ncbi:deaminase [Planctomycetota bacterium]
MASKKDKFVIGLTGSVGSGCTTLSRVIEHSGFHRISISDLIKEKFREIHDKESTKKSYGPDWRYELQSIGNRGRRGEFNKTPLSEEKAKSFWIKLAIDKAGRFQAKGVVIDGIRNIHEVKYLRKTYSSFWLLAVHADYETRWKRVEKSNVYANEKDFRRDDLRDSGEDDPAGQDVRDCVYDADYVFCNEEELHPSSHRDQVLDGKLAGEIALMKGEDDVRGPRQREVFMTTAVSQSFASSCLKRKVGALIANEEDKIPLSVGYNDNPVGMESCFLVYNGICYKDMLMEKKLEHMAPIHCPECGTLQEALKWPWTCNGKKSDGQTCTCNFKQTFFPSRNIELCTAIHAEERAIRSLGHRSAEGCTLYVNTFPCFQCSRYIKDAGIKKIVYVEAYPIPEAKDFLVQNGIDFEMYEGIMPRVFNQVFRQVQ